MRARIANSGMDFWAMLAAAALATLLLVAATQLQAQTYPVPHNPSWQDGAMQAPSAGMHGSGHWCAMPAPRGCAGDFGFPLEKTPKGSAWFCFSFVVGSETTGDGILLRIVPD
jgi:hypothetical protein